MSLADSIKQLAESIRDTKKVIDCAEIADAIVVYLDIEVTQEQRDHIAKIIFAGCLEEEP